MNEIEEMRTFVQLVDSGSATAAAAARDVAVSAVSRRLKELEHRLGVRLLNRTTRRMDLTDEGRLFYRRAVALLDDLAAAEAAVSASSAALGGTLRVAAPLSFGISHVAPAIVDFMRANPDLVVKVDLSDRRVDLVEEGFDLAIRIGDLEDSTLIAKPLTTIDHRVCASPEFIAERQRISRPDDLAALPALCYGNLSAPSNWRYTAHDGPAGSVAVNPVLVSSNGDLLRQAAEAGLGVLCEPEFIVAEALAAGRLEAVLDDYRWYGMTIHAVYPGRRNVARRTLTFIEHLADSFAGNG